MSKHFTTAAFNQEVIEASRTKPVLVDFFAVWCGPCQMMSPIIDQLADTVGDKAVVGKVDTEQEPELAEKYNVMSIPTLIIFKNGEPVETLMGVQSLSFLTEVLEKHK